MQMILITQAFAEANKMHQDGVNRFGYGITTDGRYVCSANSINDLPELFSGTDFPTVELTLATSQSLNCRGKNVSE